MAASPIKTGPSDKGDSGGSGLNPKAKEFVPSFSVAAKPAVYKSAQYRADNPSYFDQIKTALLEFDWQADVKSIYVTNGWHTEYKGVSDGVQNHMMEAVLCDYRLNSDTAPINHWYPDLDFPPGTR